MEGSGIASPKMGNLMLSNPSWWFIPHPFRKKICALQVKLDHLPNQIGVKIPKKLVVDQPPPSFDESFGCFQKLGKHPKMDGENNGLNPYEKHG